ncbi:response regulator transcription factor [Anaerolentibacter hominis]|uniref:response regulator transcription factor n=1 Tax=Anaerolentibacter hominis TaxID=3079009 RepID=UPI0031B7F3E7
MRLLVVEDEKDLREVLVKRLNAENYGTDGCGDGEEARYYLDSADYDLVILDIMIPKVDGLTLLRELRSKKIKTPVLLLTARDSIEDRVKGLDAGADDYLVKPFSFEELLARIRVLLRRQADEASNELTLGELVMDVAKHTVVRSGREISLSSKEYAILEYLLRNQGITLSREKIENHVWNYDFEGGSNVVDVYIRYLRKKLDDPFDKKLIHTVRGAGYVLKEES